MRSPPRLLLTIPHSNGRLDQGGRSLDCVLASVALELLCTLLSITHVNMDTSTTCDTGDVVPVYHWHTWCCTSLSLTQVMLYQSRFPKHFQHRLLTAFLSPFIPTKHIFAITSQLIATVFVCRVLMIERMTGKWAGDVSYIITVSCIEPNHNNVYVYTV